MIAAITSALALLLVAEAAPQATEAEDKTKASEEADSEKQVCKYQTLLNTRIPQRVCMTKRQWEESAEQARELRRRNNRSSTND